ncbi:MAG TPA: hypothetical protein VN328_08760 [Thermodesulfovibrionales bacterium]|nr:hypothetical protein [Thermodesulfovibrionales bacterium]
MIIKEKRKGERRVTRNVLFRTVLVILSIAVFAAFLRQALSEHYAQDISTLDERKISRASEIADEDAQYHFLWGLLHYAGRDKPGLEKSVHHYLISLRRNPTDSRVWVALARAYRDQGMAQYADYAIRKTLYFDKNNPSLIWEAGIFFLTQNKTADAIQALRRYIYMMPGEQENVYSLCHMMGVTPMAMLDSLLPQDYNFYKRFLNFLMSNKLYSDSSEVWKRLKKFNPERSEYLKYCNHLIEAGELDEARAIWDEFAKKFFSGENKLSDDMVWNGDFEMPVEDGGFDWRIGASEGVRVFRDKDIRWSGFASLRVSFNGKTNPGLYMARQIVPVTPGQKYRLAGYMRTEKITTLNGVVIEASNYLCDPFVKKTEPATGTNLWKKLELEFTAPQKCRTVSIGIKRERSDKVENKISGDAWIDSLTMIPARN